MLQMRARFSDITRTAQPHSANALSMDAFYACPLIIQLSKLFGLLSLASRFECEMSLTSPHREGSLSRLGTLRAHGTASTGGIAKLDLDDLLIARPGWRPATTGIPLRTTGLLVLPVNREIG